MPCNLLNVGSHEYSASIIVSWSGFFCCINSYLITCHRLCYLIRGLAIYPNVVRAMRHFRTTIY